jgi:hypothetical protein
MENVTSEKSRFGVQIIGLEEGTNVYDISVKNCHFNGVTDHKLNDLRGGFDHVVFDNLLINGQPVESPAGSGSAI